MASDAFDALYRMALASTLAMVLVLVTRQRLRAAFGAAAAYQAWLLVPLALVAALLPSIRLTNPAVISMIPSGGVPGLSGGAVTVVVSDWSGVALALWLAGAIAACAALAIGHRRFVRALGVLSERDGLHYAAHAQASPALIGLASPLIVVPSDFLTRYGAAERSLIIAHERQHARRRDPLANAAAALVQALFWFNPLAYIALGRFRFDQELACDADVMAAHPGQAQDYAQAMLKTQMASTPSLATCHWQSSHPLKERILNLQTRQSTARRLAGRLLIAVMAATCVSATMMARAEGVVANAPEFDVSIALKLASGGASPAIPSRVKSGEAIKMNVKDKGITWDGSFAVSDGGEGMATVDGVVSKSGEVYSKPRLQVKYGETARMRISDGGSGFEVSVVVMKAPPRN